jgi:hypothetical protein
MLGNRDVAGHRKRVIEGLRGEVVEIGFGSGLNVPHYPADVTTVFAVDPSLVGRKLSAGRVAESSVPIRFIGLDGEPLARVAGGCTLDRPIEGLIRDAGFDITELHHDQLAGPGFMKPWAYLYEGLATKAA